MRLASFLSVFALSFAGVVAFGCSSSSDSGSAPAGNYAPAGNGQPVGEGEACQALRAAEDARSSALGCGPMTHPACPGYIAAGNEACSEYDQGALDACIAWVGKLSCDGLKTRKCIVKVLAGTAPAGCPTTNDAGPDATEDAGTDATEDAGTDATEDAGTDAAGDATSDAAGD